jgi:hypothetical protein
VNRFLVLAAAALALAGCASRPLAPGAFRFGVTGDTPYNEREEREFLAMMQRMDAAPLEFVIHVGDFKAGGDSPCTDALYLERRAQFDASAHPFILTPGDNDWTDCRRRTNGAMDPIERLATLRRIFFASPASLGRERIATDMQSACIAPVIAACGCAAHPENRRWSRAGVVFVTLNIPGSDDNAGFDAANDAEARCRGEANRQWLAQSVREARSPGALALVIAIQADPWATKTHVYDAFMRELVDAAKRLGKPVLFIHGDTHTYRLDTPFVDEAGIPVENITRLETFGSPFVGWVEVSVDPGDPRLFAFEPHLAALVP